MDTRNLEATFASRFPGGVRTIDSHTAGEPTRLVVDGLGPLPGETMYAKLEYFRQHHDTLRLQLTREPRGHRDLLAAVVTEPVSPQSRFGLLYMDARRYPYLCGHATIGAVITLIETGLLSLDPSTARLQIDTPSGPLQARLHWDKERIDAVGLRMVPAFVYATELPLDVPEFGKYSIDLVCAGGFFAMLSAEQAGIELAPANSAPLIELGMAIIAAGNRQLTVHHPLRPEVTTIDVAEFYAATGSERHRGRSAVVYGEAHLDRSPCGTGTTAKMALLHHRGRLGLDEPYRNQGILGTSFEGRLIAEEAVGDIPGVVAEIRGRAHITGMHRFVFDPADPFPEGFLL